MDTIEYQERHRMTLAVEKLASSLFIMEKIEARLASIEKHLESLVRQGSAR